VCGLQATPKQVLEGLVQERISAKEADYYLRTAHNLTLEQAKARYATTFGTPRHFTVFMLIICIVGISGMLYLSTVQALESDTRYASQLQPVAVQPAVALQAETVLSAGDLVPVEYEEATQYYFDDGMTVESISLPFAVQRSGTIVITKKLADGMYTERIPVRVQ
jgi:hypothetical protein